MVKVGFVAANGIVNAYPEEQAPASSTQARFMPIVDMLFYAYNMKIMWWWAGARLDCDGDGDGERTTKLLVAARRRFFGGEEQELSLTARYENLSQR